MMQKRLKGVFGSLYDSPFVAFVDAFDPEDLNRTHVDCLCGAGYQGQYSRPETGNTRGSVSVAAKHWMAFFDTVWQNYDQVLVIEDDVQFQPGFAKKLKEVEGELAQDPNWSTCFVGGCMGYTCVKNTRICLNTDRRKGSNCAYAYLVSQKVWVFIKTGFYYLNINA
jgi:hypothetical protein